MQNGKKNRNRYRCCLYMLNTFKYLCALQTFKWLRQVYFAVFITWLLKNNGILINHFYESTIFFFTSSSIQILSLAHPSCSSIDDEYFFRLMMFILFKQIGNANMYRQSLFFLPIDKKCIRNDFKLQTSFKTYNQKIEKILA